MTNKNIREKIYKIIEGDNSTIFWDKKANAILSLFQEMQNKIIEDAAMHDICGGCAYEVREATNRILLPLASEGKGRLIGGDK